ncbi:mCG144897, partial [Mus musculus]
TGHKRNTSETELEASPLLPSFYRPGRCYTGCWGELSPTDAIGFSMLLSWPGWHTSCGYWCNSGMTDTEVTNNFLMVFVPVPWKKTHILTVNLVKSLWLERFAGLCEIFTSSTVTHFTFQQSTASIHSIRQDNGSHAPVHKILNVHFGFFFLQL